MTLRGSARALLFLVVFLLAERFALPSQAAAAEPDTALLRYEGPDREQRLVAAAKREGSVVFYTTFAEGDLVGLIGPFEKQYGVKVSVWRAGTNSVMQRTLNEAAAKRYDVDVVHFGAPEMEALHREGILQPVVSPYFKSLFPGAVPAHREWAATLLSVWVQAYNTKLIAKKDLPESYQDLIDPKWKGKLGIEAKDQDWFATVVLGMGEQKGLQFFRELAARNGISVRQGHTLLTNMVISGEVPFALNLYNYMPEQAKRKGAPIDWIAIEPAAARANAIGIVRHAPHPNTAMLLYDYMLSAAQAYLASADYVPANTGVASPLGHLRYTIADPAVTLDQADKWTRLYEQIVVKRNAP